MGNNMDRMISDNYAALYTIASSIESIEDYTLAEAQAVLADQQKFWNYESIMLMDEKGVEKFKVLNANMEKTSNRTIGGFL